MSNAIAQNTHNLKKLNKNLSGDLPRNLLLSVIKIILEKKKLVVKTFSGLETNTETWIFRSQDRDRDLDKMNSSALESRYHGLEITTLAGCINSNW